MHNSTTYSFIYTTKLRGECKENTVEWSLQEFQDVLKGKSYQKILTTSSDYPDVTDADSKFQLKLQFIGQENNLIEIYYLAPFSVSLTSHLSIAFLSNGRYIYKSIATKTGDNIQRVPAKQWQLLAVLLKQTIKDLPKIYMKFKFDIETSHSNNDEEYCKHNNEHTDQLKSDIENLLKEPLFSDVTVKSVEGMEFCAHKAVLATRSPVLQAHFQHNTLESVTNMVECPFESEVLQEVIHFIYTAKTTSKLDEIPEMLLEAADYYQLCGLKSLCEESLGAKLSAENVIETLKLADVHSAANLKKESIRFINDGRAKEVIESKGWEMLESVALVKSIYEYKVRN